MNQKQIIQLLKQGGIGVLATDTIYGIHGLALKKEIVEKIYQLRGRNPKKPFIILISSLKDLEKFKIKLGQKTEEFLNRIWPNKISVILPCPQPEWECLHRGAKTLAFRLPNKPDLLEILKATGPLISTSVNKEGEEPARTIEQAREYFGKQLDFYQDQGKLESEPSTLIKIQDRKIEILRPGEVKIETNF